MKHKRYPNVLVVLAALLVLALPVSGRAQFNFITNADNAITITGYPGPSGAVTIPSLITGLPVTGIEADAFSNSYATSITIPSGVTNIGNRAFSSCFLLTAITVQSNNPAYSSVDGELFNKDQTTLIQYPAGKAARQITIPSSVTAIGDQAFYSHYRLTNVVFGNSVTSVGDQAFYGCGLTSVTIPNSITNVGDQAFACFNLSAIKVDTLNPAYTSVHGVLFDKNQTALIQYPAGKAGGQFTIPDSITTIGNGAFSGCEHLANIVIPDSVTDLGDSAFSGCSVLRNIVIPDSVSNIGNEAFSDCALLTVITVRSNNLAYSSVDGVLFNKNQTALIQYPTGKAGSQYTIPNSVTAIGDEAFSYCGFYSGGLTRVTIPNSVTTIGDSAFYYCYILTNITISDSVTTIGNGAFSGCEHLANIVIPDSVTGLGDSAFSGCSVLRNITIPNSVTTIGNGAFSDCEHLANIVIPDSVTDLGDSAFSDCLGLTKIVIGNSVTTIGDAAFYRCSALTNIRIPDSVTDLGGAAFAGCADLTSVTIGNGIRSLLPAWMDVDSGVRQAVGTFQDCVNLTDITIPDHVTTIGDSAFSSCGKLDSVTIPDSVTTIGNQAFARCSGLTNIVIGNSVTTIGDQAFFDCGSYYPGLTSVTIPGSVSNIGNEAFSACYLLTAITVQSNNPAYSSVDGVLFNKDQTALIKYPAGRAGGQFTIPSSVTAIRDEAFYNVSGLTNITIPDSITNLGGGAFAGCEGMTSVTIGNGIRSLLPAWENIPEGFWIVLGTFQGCASLTNITIPDSVTTIGDWTFSGCSALTNITIPDSVTTIGDSAFSGCWGLTSVYFQGDAPNLGGSYVFSDAGNTTVFYRPGSAGWGTTFGGLPTALWLLPNPLILSSGLNFGGQSNRFGFSISWATNTAVVVEASTNLQTWTPVSTNMLVNGTNLFWDSDWAHYSRRFYRVHVEQ